MITVVVSPHLDDAALSVPAFMRARAGRGARVVALTAFTEGDASHALRREEDRVSLAQLGVEPLHLGLRDAPYRRGLPRSFEGLVFSPVPPGDADAATVARALVVALAALSPDEVLMPLAVGEHVDHRVVHAAHGAVCARRIGFYEDRPYALVRHGVRARLARLGASVDGQEVEPWPWALDDYVASARAAPFIRAYLPEPERERSLRVLAEPLASPATPSGLRLRVERHVFERADLEVAARAARAYRSQVEDLFGGADVAEALSEGRAPYEERLYWTPGRP